MKTWENGGIAPPFLTLVLDGDEWSASHPSYFTSGERATDTHCVGGYVGLRTSQDTVE
jgi:hypothetical protein